MGDTPGKTGRKRDDVGPGRPPKEHQFKPGNPGGGRPKGTSITARLRRIVLEDDGGKVAEALAREITKAALRGDYRFVREVLDRLDGPVKQQIEASVGSTIKVIHADDEALLDGDGDG